MDIDQLFSFGNGGALQKDEIQEKSTHHEIFRFYSMALDSGVNIFPLVWNPSLEQLGEGATGRISQSPLNKATSFAFKRFSPWRIQSGLSKEKFRSLQYQSMISEIAALQDLPLYNHPNVVNLEGLSWEILNDKEVLPVLVFKKAEFGDLENFLSLPEAADLTIEDRMAICGEISRALLTMHERGIVHGDIKPGNILIFKGPQDDPDSFGCKVTDFGYSCLGSGDDDLVFLPRTIPWEAPEWHPREFTLSRAKKADMYSFGLLCLWLVFHKDTLPNSTMPNLSIEKAFSGHYGLENSALAILKENGSLLDSVLHVVSSKPGLSTSTRSTLGEVFKLSLQHNASDRVSIMDPLVELLSIHHDYGPPSDVEAITVVPKWHESFKVESCYYDLEACDFRVGRFIIEQLIDAAKRTDDHGCKDCSCNAAFQAAICYSFGFGVHIDHEVCNLYLKQSGKSRNELEAVIQRIRDGSFDVRSLEALIAADYQGTLATDYVNEGIEDEAILEYTAMIQARERVLGTGHFSTRRARAILANIYNKTGRYQDALLLKEKELELCYEETSPDRFAKQNILVLKNSLAEDYEHTGRVGESENIRLDVLRSCSQGADGSSQDPGDAIPMHRLLRLEALCGLSSISFAQGEYKMAVDRGSIALRECEDFLGPDHSLTLVAKFGLGKALWEIGEQTEAAQTVQELVYARERLLGASHMDTVITADKLCLMYVELRKVNEAEEVFVQFIQPTIFNLSTLKESSVGIGRQYTRALADLGQMDRARCIQEHRLAVYMQQLGASHQNTIVMMSDLAITYQKQSNWKRAEPLQRDVIEWMDKRNGPDHPQTLTAMRNLSDTLFNQGKWHEAAELGLKELHIRQAKYPDIDMEKIVAIDKVTRALVNQEKWGDALENLVQEVEWRLLRTPVEKPALNETAVQESIGFAALSALHSGAYDMARKYLAVFFKRVLANTLVPVNIQTMLAVLDPLARICERVEWLEEAEQLLILDILIRTKHLGSGDNGTVVDEREFRAVKLCQRQGKAFDQGIFNPTAIIERGEKVI